MAGWGKERQSTLIRELRDRTKHVRDVVDTHYKPIDLAAPSDEEFMNFIAMKQLENPNWLLALPFVQGGTSVLSRYEKLTGLR